MAGLMSVQMNLAGVINYMMVRHRYWHTIQNCTSIAPAHVFKVVICCSSVNAHFYPRLTGISDVHIINLVVCRNLNWHQFNGVLPNSSIKKLDMFLRRYWVLNDWNLQEYRCSPMKSINTTTENKHGHYSAGLTAGFLYIYTNKPFDLEF